LELASGFVYLLSRLKQKMLSSNKQTRSAVKSQKKKKAVKVEYCNYEEADSRASIKGRRKGAGAGGQRCKAREL
jgi:hypothetical protein